MPDFERDDQQCIATIVLVGSQLLAAATAFFVNLLASRTLEPDHRGELALALQIGYLLTVLAIFGTDRPYIATQQGSFAQQYVGFVRLVHPGIIGLGLVGAVALIASAMHFETTIFLLVVACVTFAISNVFTSGVRVAYIASRNWKRFAANATIVQSVVLFGALLLYVLGVDRSGAWMFIYSISGIVPLSLLVIAIRGSRQSIQISKSDRRAIRLRGLRLLPAALGNTAMLRSDRLILPFLGSTAELGTYVTVATVMEMAVWPTQQWVDASLHRWSASTQRRKVGRAIVGVMTVVAVLAALLGALSYMMVTLLLPPDYSQAVSVIVPLGIASVVYGWTRVQQGLLIALGASGRVSLVEGVGSVTAIIAYLTLIPQFGILGAAMGSIIGYSVCALAGAWVLSRG